MTTTSTTDKITAAVLAKIANTTTEDLLRHHEASEQMELAGSDRLVIAIIADEITRRLDLNAEMDAIYEDLELAMDLTYNQAMRLAMHRVAA